MHNRRILVINPGSTSTKIAVYENTRSVYLNKLVHSYEELKSFPKIIDQLTYRYNLIVNELMNEKINLEQIKVVIGRGGLLKPIPSGIYKVNDRMIDDLRIGIQGEHASNLGGLIAHELKKLIPDALALIADPVVVDEMNDVARVTGHPLFTRRSIFHALNQKAIARSYAESTHKVYEELNLIIVHLGGGISVGAHQKGKVIDVNQALNGEGPMSPERSGTLPIGELVDVCFSGKYDRETIQKMINGEGGYVAYFGTNEAYKIELQAKQGDEKAKHLQEAMGYQVAKYIGSLAAVLKGNVDAILLTGGLAHNKDLTNYISEHVSFLAPI
ncbi:MAG TPA: butyrate kinase, partial [Bacteroidales bacterium]|nr:butyrate kinase [Bacteroidales bacterium]